MKRPSQKEGPERQHLATAGAEIERRGVVFMTSIGSQPVGLRFRDLADLGRWLLDNGLLDRGAI